MLSQGIAESDIIPMSDLTSCQQASVGLLSSPPTLAGLQEIAGTAQWRPPSVTRVAYTLYICLALSCLGTNSPSTGSTIKLKISKVVAPRRACSSSVPKTTGQVHSWLFRDRRASPTPNSTWLPSARSESPPRLHFYTHFPEYRRWQHGVGGSCIHHSRHLNAVAPALAPDAYLDFKSAYAHFLYPRCTNCPL